jgi:hypothetical protein
MAYFLGPLSLYTTTFYLARPYFPNIRVAISLLNATILSLVAVKPSILPIPTHLNDYITAYFTYDLVTGHITDRKTFGLLTGYIHHSVYIVLLLYLRKTNESQLIYYFLPFEIPTAILDLKKLIPAQSNYLSNIFGITFVAFRLIYNIQLITLMPNPYYSGVTTLMLALHTYWFSVWLLKIKRSSDNVGR